LSGVENQFNERDMKWRLMNAMLVEWLSTQLAQNATSP